MIGVATEPQVERRSVGGDQFQYLCGRAADCRVASVWAVRPIQFPVSPVASSQPRRNGGGRRRIFGVA
jgi:hypothetical protein